LELFSNSNDDPSIMIAPNNKKKKFYFSCGYILFRRLIFVNIIAKKRI